MRYLPLLLSAAALACGPTAEPSPSPGPSAPEASGEAPAVVSRALEAATRANDAAAERATMASNVLRIASDAQAWALKPADFGGGGKRFAGLALADLGYAPDGDGAYRTRHHGSVQTYRLTVWPDSFALHATSPTASGDARAVVTGLDAASVRVTPSPW